MVELMFGGGSPMWTAAPSVGMPYQPIAFGNTPLPAPGFSPPMIAGGRGSTGYNGGIAPVAQQTLAGPGLAVAYPYASNLLAPQLADANGVVTAASVLAAVALRRGQPHGPTNDAEVEEFVYDALELLPGAADVEIRCESGRVMLTGSVPHKRTKRDAGEIAWAIPGVLDVQNNVAITSRRRARAASREGEPPAGVSVRKG